MSRAPRYVGRDKDERDLKIIELFTVYGLTSTVISRRLGISRGAVMGYIKRVRDDDMAMSGERDVHRYYEQGALTARSRL